MLKSILRPALVGICLLLTAVGAQAANLTVTNTADDGLGSLRQAINDAIANAEANTVTFSIPLTDPGFGGDSKGFTINLTSSLPSIPLAPFTLSNTQKQGLTIKGDNTFRIFRFVDSAVVVFNNLTISNGSSGLPLARVGRRMAGIDPAAGNGGGIYMGNSSTLTLTNCVIKDNGAALNGGGIYMSNSTTAATISNTTISGNSAPNGDGGGIFISDSGTLNIDDSTVNKNSAVNGGGIYNGTSGTVNAASNTFDANTAMGSGGAINNTATITLTDNTVTGNTAGTGGGIYNSFTATLNNNIVAMNSATAGSDLFGGLVGGAAFTGNYNLIGNADDSLGLESAPNISGTTANPINPMLGPLQNNGGETFTHAILAGSPAIDAGTTIDNVDQRGFLRPVDDMSIPNGTGNAADIGAFEFQNAPTAALVSVGGRITLTNGKCQAGLTNATVILTDMNGSSRAVRIGRGGYYQFDDVDAGATYIVSVRSRLYTFDSQMINVVDNVADIDFDTFSELFKCVR